MPAVALPHQPIPCYACAGSGVTTRTRHSVVTKPDGTQEPRIETYTGPCSTCHGSGRIQ
jgi:DnaJ-class molecular chaperone